MVSDKVKGRSFSLQILELEHMPSDGGICDIKSAWGAHLEADEELQFATLEEGFARAKIRRYE